MNLFASALVGLFALSAHAAEPPAQDIEELARHYKQTKKKFLKSDTKSRKLMGSIYVLTERMKKVSHKRDKLNNKMINVRGNVKVLARQAARLEEKIKGQRRELSRRLRAIYMLGEKGMMRVMFSATSSHDLDRNLKYLKKISDRDYELIKGYESNLAQLTDRKKELKTEVTKLLGIQKTIAKNEQQIEDDQRSKRRLLLSLKSQKQNYLKKMQGIRAQSKSQKKFDELFDEIGEVSFFEVRGKLKAPVGGALIQSYGMVQSHEFNYRLSHKGLFFSADDDEAVRGVHSGRVAYAGKISGYGNAVIIDHGDHYYSVYGYNKKLKVSRGDKIKSGQQIAVAGESALGSGVYFEIRHFSDAVDPRAWLKGHKRGRL